MYQWHMTLNPDPKPQDHPGLAHMCTFLQGPPLVLHAGGQYKPPKYSLLNMSFALSPNLRRWPSSRPALTCKGGYSLDPLG
jgi:hypothetical protein